MAFLGFHRRHRGHDEDRNRERNEREWADNRTRDWGERNYEMGRESGQNRPRWSQRDYGDDYGRGRSGANPFERPEEFGQNRGDPYNDWRAAERDDWRAAEGDFGKRDYSAVHDRGFNDRWQESYGPHAGRGQSSYRDPSSERYANESYGAFPRGREQGTHGAYWSPERTDFSDFGRGGEMSTYNAGSTGSFRGRGPKGYRRSDERIREDVCECLTDDERIDATNIDVQVKECEVTLTGTVNSREEKRRAEDLIDRLSGVKDINNNLRVVNEGGLIEGSQSKQGSASSQSTGRETGSRH